MIIRHMNSPQRDPHTRYSSPIRSTISAEQNLRCDWSAIPPYARELLEAQWQRAGIENDYLFAVVMQRADNFLQLAQRILPERNLTHVMERHARQASYPVMSGMHTRRHVYSAIDRFQFVVDMQMRSTSDLREHIGSYQQMLEIQDPDASAAYRNLPDSYAMTICPYDPFGLGRPLYHCRSIAPSVSTNHIYLSTRNADGSISKELRNFLHLVNGEEPADDYCQQLADDIREARRSPAVRRTFMSIHLQRLSLQIPI